MYRIEKYESTISVEEYIRDYVNVSEFVEYCKKCPNYQNVWSCPPYDFNPEEYWRQFSTLYVTARKIIFNGEVTEKESYKILAEVKDSMSQELYELEKVNPGSRALSAGSCSMCRTEGCTRPAGKPCRHPELMRYSIESIGGNVGLTISKLMGIKLEWMQEGKVPSYFVLAGGLLKK